MQEYCKNLRKEDWRETEGKGEKGKIIISLRPRGRNEGWEEREGGR